MSILAKLADLRVNVLITFLGAALIILLIKVTPLLLPAKYYFDFSKLMAGDSEPFIVDPPGVTGRMLCDLIAKYGIPPGTFRRQIFCNEDYEKPMPYTPAEIDEIYSIILQSDDSLRRSFVDAARNSAFAPMSDAEVRNTVSHQTNTAAAFDLIYRHYASTLTELLMKGPSDLLGRLYEKFAGLPENPEGPTDPTDTISEADVERLVQANRSFRADLNVALYAMSIPPIRKSKVDDIVNRLTTRGLLTYNVSDYYTGSMSDAFRKKMVGKFESFGVVTDIGVFQRKVFNDINKFSGMDYTIAILLRLTPVFLFGIFAGAMLGRGELLSIALAGGIAAFLLSWPLILMWDRLVQSNWADKKNIFFSFYAAYILSFFLLARAAGVLGAWLREQNLIGTPTAAVTRLRWSHVAMNLVAALAINGLVYAWNVYLPLAGGMGR